MRYNVSLTNWLADACVANKSSRQCAAPRRNTRMREKEKAREGERRKEEERRRERAGKRVTESRVAHLSVSSGCRRCKVGTGASANVGGGDRAGPGRKKSSRTTYLRRVPDTAEHSTAAEDSRAWHSRGQHSGGIQSEGRIIEHDTRDHVALAALVRSTRNLTSQTFTASNTLSLTCAYP